MYKAKITYIFTTVLIITIMGTGCKKDTLPVFKNVASAYFYTESPDFINFNREDSLTYSFAIRPSNMQEDTVKIPVRITGVPADHDRKVNIEPVKDSSNAVEGKHYKILPCTIKAGAYEDSVEVVVMKTPELDSTEVRVMLQIVKSNDFITGPVEDTRYTIKINNILSKPSNWDNLLFFFFGSYSQVKYKFIIDQTGLYEFVFLLPNGGVDFLHYLYFQQLVRKKWKDYVQKNGPLIDENGNTVTFPG